MQGSEPIQDKPSKFLFKYRITPHVTTGIPPCELLMNCRLRSKFDLLHPDTMISERVEHKQQVQGATCNTNKPLRQFKIGNTMFAEDFTSSKQKWIEGTITDITGPLSYKIKLTDEIKVRRPKILKDLLSNLRLKKLDNHNLFRPHQGYRNHLNNRSY